MGALILRLAVWFLALAIVVADASAGLAPVVAKPLLWTVSKGDNRIHLLGSIHLLPPEVSWKSPGIDAAMDASSVFVFEAPVHGAADAMARFVERHGRIDGGRSLSELIGEEAHELVSRAAWQVQYPPRLLGTVRPWLAAVYLEIHASLMIGASPHFGVDHVIERLARARQARLVYLETVEEQLSYFLKLSRAAEVRYLRSVARDILDRPEAPRALIGAWVEGDAQKLQAQIDAGLSDVPQLREQLLTVRNRKWLPMIEEMLGSGHVHFVTVGAAHLTGRDGLIGMLRARGYKVEGPATGSAKGPSVTAPR